MDRIQQSVSEIVSAELEDLVRYAGAFYQLTNQDGKSVFRRFLQAFERHRRANDLSAAAFFACRFGIA